MIKLLDSVSDYCSSEHFLFLDPVLKPRAEYLLTHWCRLAEGQGTLPALEKSLRDLAGLDIPVEVRKALPALLREFFNYLAATGRYPAAAQWVENISLLRKKHEESIRENGTVRGETFRKKYTDVGPNDPCPCGSAKKFKKCCRDLIS
jgi:hypothetical protein